MKKSLLAAALLSLAGLASAGELSGTVKYDYDKMDGGDASLHRVTTGLKYDFGTVGAVDGGFVASQARLGGKSANGQGYEVGYSNGLKVGPVALTGRLSFSQLSFDPARIDVYKAEVGAALPVTTNLSLVGGYEHIQLKRDADAIANRGIIGVDYAITKQLSVRAQYARTWSEGDTANGLTTAVSYKF